MLIPEAIKAPWFERWALKQAHKHGFLNWHDFDRQYRESTKHIVQRFDHDKKQMRPFTDCRSLFDEWFTGHLRLHGHEDLAAKYELLPRQVRDDLQAKVTRIKNQMGMRWHRLVEHDSIIRVDSEAKAHM